MSRSYPMQTPADARAERHARTFMASQLPPVDPRVARLEAEGYLPRQIAMILGMPVSDVRLMLAVTSQRQTVTTTRGKA